MTQAWIEIGLQVKHRAGAIHRTILSCSGVGGGGGGVEVVRYRVMLSRACEPANRVPSGRSATTGLPTAGLAYDA